MSSFGNGLYLGVLPAYKSDDNQAIESARVPGMMAAIPGPVNVYGLNGTITYTLFAENFEGSCWGERINAAISHAIEHGQGSAIIQLPSGDLNMSTPIRFAHSAPGDACSRLNNTRSFAAVWACAKKNAGQSDLTKGLTLMGMGGTTGGVWQGGTVLHWVGSSNNVMIDMPAPWHCQIRRLTLHGMWAAGITGIRYRAGWEYGTNGESRHFCVSVCLNRYHIGSYAFCLSSDLSNVRLC